MHASAPPDYPARFGPLGLLNAPGDYSPPGGTIADLRATLEANRIETRALASDYAKLKAEFVDVSMALTRAREELQLGRLS